jgi:hypothetical protein
MKKFLFKTSFFIIPFAVLYLIVLFYYSNKESPDLLRIGYIPNFFKNYHKGFTTEKINHFDKISKPKRKTYTILTIGDSFSEQEGFGYKNFLSDSFSVLHIDRFISQNQIQTLSKLCNGDFFDNYNIRYVVLQNIERNVIENIKKMNLNDKIMIGDIDSMIKEHKKIDNQYPDFFFSENTIKFPLYYIPKFIFKKNYLSAGSAYNFELNSPSFFSNNSQKLLFYKDDLLSIKLNNVNKNIDSLNLILNTLSIKLNEKKIKLIFLTSADKYDFYYDFISEKKKLTKPLFFELMKKQNKDYIYIDSKEILTPLINKQKDIYFYDDTHWSPTSTRIIAKAIIDSIKKYK